ncbi:uncharacterized protein [Miscanthus floridulus]|uniref:uncharacterized protein n=1 Tax=Miscanthus floridulus TaxID=154761 RepID=UPI0034578F0A
MQLQAESHSLKGEPRISVSVPPTRSDILHARDLSEDVAIAYGFNNVPKSKPKCMAIGGRQPLNRFSDKIRAEINADGVKRNFYPGDKLPLWHDELEPHNSLLDILAAGNPDPMVQ